MSSIPIKSSTPRRETLANFDFKRLERKIDSFSFENSSPSWSSSGTQETSSTLSSPNEAGKLALTQEERNLITTSGLRSGKEYKRRSTSLSDDKIQGGQSKVIFKKNLVLSKVNNTMATANNMNFVSQLVFNNVPLLGAELGSNLANEVEIFIKCCEHIDNCITEQEDKKLFLQLLPTKFRGRAALILEGIEYKTLEELKNFLITKLVTTKPYQVQLNELRSCRQFPGELLSDYGRRVMQLLKGCKALAKKKYSYGAEAIYSDLEETAIFTFKAGILNPHHRFFLLNDTETTLENVIRKAEQLEESEFQMLIMSRQNQTSHLNFMNPMNANSSFTNDVYNATSKYGYFSNNNALPQSVTPNPNLLTNLNMSPTTLEPMHENFNSSNTRPQSQALHYDKPPFHLDKNNKNNYINNSTQPNSAKVQPNKCGFCNRFNHTYADCRIRKATPFCPKCKVYGHNIQNCQKPPSRFSANVMEIRSVKTRCNFCQRTGHSMKECRAKQL